MSNILCPRCQTETRRKPKYIGGGIIGFFLQYAIAGRACPKCGEIPNNEFTDEVRSAMRTRFFIEMAAIILGFVVFVSVTVFIALQFFPPE